MKKILSLVLILVAFTVPTKELKAEPVTVQDVVICTLDTPAAEILTAEFEFITEVDQVFIIDVRAIEFEHVESTRSCDVEYPSGLKQLIRSNEYKNRNKTKFRTHSNRFKSIKSSLLKVNRKPKPKTEI